MAMRRTIAALLVLLALPVAANAQMAPAPGQMPLEITKQERPPESNTVVERRPSGSTEATT